MKFLVTALLVGTSVTAYAQNSLSGVSGSVTVTSGTTTASAAPNAVLKNGDIVTASAGASTTVNVGNCSVPLKAGQSLVVDTALPCDKLQASVKSITLPATNFVSNIPGGPLGLGVGVVGLGLVINEARKDNNTSSTPTPTPTPAPAPAPAPVAQPPKASGA